MTTPNGGLKAKATEIGTKAFMAAPPPAQNAIPPAPVRTITRASSSASKRSSAASSASAVGPSTALRGAWYVSVGLP